SNACGQSSSAPSNNPIRWRERSVTVILRTSAWFEGRPDRLLAESGQVMGELLPPPRPVVGDVVPPQVQLVRDALLLQYGGRRASGRQRAGRVGLPVTLTHGEQDEQSAAQPVKMVAGQVGQVVGRVVEVRRG